MINITQPIIGIELFNVCFLINYHKYNLGRLYTNNPNVIWDTWITYDIKKWNFNNQYILRDRVCVPDSDDVNHFRHLQHTNIHRSPGGVKINYLKRAALKHNIKFKNKYFTHR